MDKKSFLMGTVAYVLWGILPLYWKLLNDFSPVFVLANRIIWSAIFVMAILAISKRLPQLVEALKNKKTMKYLMLSAISVTINWGLYIFAVNSSHVVDASLGYYINPLMVFAAGLILFKEKCDKLSLAALILAAAGVLVITLRLGHVPYISLIIAFSFMVYGVCKKLAHVEGVLSVGIETMLVLPVALLFVAFSRDSADAFSKIDFIRALLLIGAGAVTSTPLILYAYGINGISFIAMGFLQYISPTFMLIIGLFQGEQFNLGQGIGFALIWAALALFSASQLKKHKHEVMPKDIEG